MQKRALLTPFVFFVFFCDWLLPKFTENTHKIAQNCVYNIKKLFPRVADKRGSKTWDWAIAPWLLGARRPCNWVLTSGVGTKWTLRGRNSKPNGLNQSPRVLREGLTTPPRQLWSLQERDREVIEAQTLNFKPNVKFWRLIIFFGGGPPSQLRCALDSLGQSLARVKIWGRSTL